MAQLAVLRGACAAALALVPLAANAVPIWGTWTLDSATTSTASLPDGRSATLTGFPVSGGSGGGGTANPPVPGIPSGQRAPVTTFFTTATAGVNPNPGDLIFSLDLGNWGVDAETTFGLEDVVDFAFYRLELLDSSLNVLSLAGIQLSQHNLFYTGGAIGDYDLSLDPTTGVITAVKVHDSGDPTAGRHSGLAIFGNLPGNTRYVRLYVAGTASFLREGLRLSLSASPVPEPASALLVAAALGSLGGLRARGR